MQLLRLAAMAAGGWMAAQQPALDYTVRVSPSDSTGFEVSMHVGHAPRSFSVAMAAHPEYDDRYWRYVRDFRVESPSGRARFTHAEGPVWRILDAGGDVRISYRLALPPAPRGPGAPAGPASRAAYRPFVSPTGALVGGMNGFMYLVDAPNAAARVALDIPADWRVATGLQATPDPRVFLARGAEELLDAPILMGALRVWTFRVDGVPHHVAYWPAPDAQPFDTARFVDGISRIVRQTISLFGSAPYRDYSFLLQDHAYGSLEHANSVTVGIPSADLARDPGGYFEEIAHEYFHAWNMMSIRPPEFAGVSYETRPRTPVLWWSEGATMFYADLLARRAGLAVDDSTRPAHLARLLGQYYTTSGNRLLSPERVSRAEYGLQGTQLGDNTASTHLQGELIAAALDLTIRSATHGRRSMDDAMRGMMARHAGAKGFTADDVAREVARACGCDVRPFFRAHVRGAEPLDFDRYLALIGLTARVTWTPSLKGDRSPQPDLRVFAWQPAGEAGLRLYVLDTASVWERAGLHTGDRLVSIDGAPIADLAAFRARIGPLGINDSVQVAVRRPGGDYRTRVVVTGFDRAVVTIGDLPAVTPEQRALRDAWLAGR